MTMIRRGPSLKAGIYLCLDCPNCGFPFGVIWEEGSPEIFMAVPVDPKKATNPQATVNEIIEVATKVFGLKYLQYCGFSMELEVHKPDTIPPLWESAYATRPINFRDVEYFKEALAGIVDARQIEII
jgi:hypothetical protein